MLLKPVTCLNVQLLTDLDKLHLNSSCVAVQYRLENSAQLDTRVCASYMSKLCRVTCCADSFCHSFVKLT